jgi:hypothetical protein
LISTHASCGVVIRLIGSRQDRSSLDARAHEKRKSLSDAAPCSRREHDRLALIFLNGKPRKRRLFGLGLLPRGLDCIVSR